MRPRLICSLPVTVLGAVLSLPALVPAQCPPVEQLHAPDSFERMESCSIDGDVAVVGDWLDGDQGSQAGAVYVYRHDGQSWQFEEKLFAPDAAASDRFGQTVAVSGDVIAVGVEGDDGGVGSVSVYRHDGSSWQFETQLRSPGGTTGFGRELGLDGGVLAVSAEPKTVEMFRYQGKFVGWQADGVVTGSNPFFNESVDVAGDLLVVGSFNDTVGTITSGAVHAYDYDGSNWLHVDLLTGADRQDGDNFGASVSTDGTTIAVGATGADNKVGAVYVFRKAGGTWQEQQKLSSSGGTSAEFFGGNLSVSGNGIVVGAQGRDRAYGFEFGAGTWTQSAVYAATGSRLGVSVSASGPRALVITQQRVYEFPIAELRLVATPAAPLAGDLLTLDTFAGLPNNPCGLFLTGINGAHTFQPIVLFKFGSNHHLTIAGTVPTGLAGLSLEFTSFAIAAPGNTVVSDPATVNFQ